MSIYFCKKIFVFILFFCTYFCFSAYADIDLSNRRSIVFLVQTIVDNQNTNNDAIRQVLQNQVTLDEDIVAIEVLLPVVILALGDLVISLEEIEDNQLNILEPNSEFLLTGQNDIGTGSVEAEKNQGGTTSKRRPTKFSVPSGYLGSAGFASVDQIGPGNDSINLGLTAILDATIEVSDSLIGARAKLVKDTIEVYKKSISLYKRFHNFQSKQAKFLKQLQQLKKMNTGKSCK